MILTDITLVRIGVQPSDPKLLLQIVDRNPASRIKRRSVLLQPLMQNARILSDLKKQRNIPRIAENNVPVTPILGQS
jgi:hypothetical protein